MKAIDTGNEKVKKICEVLKRDTLEPAKKEAEAIVEAAHGEAQAILERARNEAREHIENAKREIDREKKVFETSLAMGAKQAVTALEQDIEALLVSSGLEGMIQRAFPSESAAAELLSALVTAVNTAGIDGNLLLELPKHYSKEKILSHLSDSIRKQLEDVKEGVSLKGGIRLKLLGHNLTLDFSEQAIKELFSAYVREDFRKKIFNA